MRVLPADVYDTLELSALAFGGVGADIAFEDAGTERQKPCCILGLAEASTNIDFGNIDEEDAQEPLNPVSAALHLVGVWGGLNDAAVARINQRKGKDLLDSKVTFSEWCDELDVERGE